LYQILAIIIGYLLMIISYWVIAKVLEKYHTPATEGIEGAGSIIGILERILVLTFVLTNQYTAITIIFAAKSIARFNELDNRETAEYYLIGSFLSITIALVVGIIIKIILGMYKTSFNLF